MNSEKILYDLPIGWVLAPLKEITIPILKVNKAYEGNGSFMYIDIEAIDNKAFILKDLKRYLWSNAPSRAQQKVKTNDILFSTVRPYLKNIALVPQQFGGEIASTGFCVIRPLLINYKYVFYYVISKGFIDSVNQLAKGTSYPAVTNSVILEQPITFPGLEQQNRIVEKIEELFSQLDEATEGLIKAQKMLSGYKHTLLSNAFEGKLTIEWRKENPSAKTSIKSDVKLGVELSKLPRKWKWVKVGEIANITMGQSPPGSSYNNRRIGIPLVNGPVEFGPTPFSFTILSKWTTEPTKLCFPGDLIICVRGSTTGRQNIAGFKACIGRGVAAIRSTNAEQKYLYHYFNYSRRKIFEMGTGTTFPSISHDQLINFPIPICSAEEQLKIVNEIEYKFTIMENLEQTIIENIEKIGYYKESILKQAFEGKLVIQNIEDESAEKLFEKIKNEKEIYLKEQMLKTKNDPKMKQTKKTLVETLIESFQGKEFTYDELRTTLLMSYDDIKDQLFLLLEKGDKLTVKFSTQKQKIVYKLKP